MRQHRMLTVVAVGLLALAGVGLGTTQVACGASCCPGMAPDSTAMAAGQPDHSAHAAAGQPDHSAHAAAAPKQAAEAHATVQANLDAAAAAIDAAAKAIQDGDKDAAQAALDNARKALLAVKSAVAQSGTQGQFVNTRCPMMGNPINPAKVPASLQRPYKGQTVAFCCGGCPAGWDRLTDAEKDAKLRAAAAKI